MGILVLFYNIYEQKLKTETRQPQVFKLIYKIQSYTV